MGKILAITQQKGGTGKTTTAAAIGAGLARQRKKVLYIDLDAQANLTYIMQAESTRPGAFSILTKQCETAAAIQHTPQGDIIAAGQNLATADITLTQTGKEYRLREALAQILAQYDYIIIDTPPALGTLTINALTAADDVIITCQADIFSIQATAQIAATLDTVKRYCNPALHIAGLLITRYNPRQIITRDIAAALENAAATIKTKVFRARIRETVTIREAQARRESVFSYAQKSNAAEDYNNLIKEYTK